MPSRSTGASPDRQPYAVGVAASQDRIRIEVIEADALALHADVLVLKYAQALYGVDANAVERVELDRSLLPPPGGYRTVPEPTGIASDTLMLIGVVPLRDFGYAEIRDFARRALRSVASDRPHAQTVVLTLHGPGYGLDEVEAFDSELAGILDAIRERDVTRGLQSVVIAEVAPGRADRMKRRLDELLRKDAEVAVGASVNEMLSDEPLADRFRRVGWDSSERGHAFVAMPFSEDFEDLFHYGISSAVRTAGLLCERIDQQAFTGDVVTRLQREIRGARLVVADLTGSNANVFLEVGYAWGCGVPTVLISRRESPLKFDVQGQRCLRYSGIKDAERLLTSELQQLLTDGGANPS
jgi:hypothetical protein